MIDEKLKPVLDELKRLRFKLRIEQILPTDEIIDDYESDIGMKFSDDYRFFLKEASDSLHNGKDALRVTQERNSPGELCEEIVQARKIGLPENWLPICEDNSNYYCLDGDGKVRFWDHNGTSDESWPDLATWIKEVWIEGR